jgi:hypothetical protein
MAEPGPRRIAMWSGPRNISTAMMRAWENRPDTFVTDEPFYAHYLAATGLDHPGREEVIASQEQDWRKVAARLTGEVPDGKHVWYQKHMAHHLLPDMEREGEWLSSLEPCFLIRDPAEMLTSLLHFLPEPTLADTGLPQQVALFERVSARTGRTPPVLDARDVLTDPEAMLRRLCAELDLPFTEAMLSWPPGRRPTDGVWAKHWYAAVEQTTTFQPYRPKHDPFPSHLRALLADCTPLYDQLHALRLSPA